MTILEKFVVPNSAYKVLCIAVTRGCQLASALASNSNSESAASGHGKADKDRDGVKQVTFSCDVESMR
jgi:hypothetical protein